MKIAALIRAYHRPEQLDRLLERLSGALWAPYVHIDRKADIRQFAGSRDKAVFIADRVQVNWGGLSQVEATIRLFRAALRDPAVTHFYNMSGQCWPVKTDDQIRDRIAGLPAGSANLMERHAMPVEHKPLDRYTRWWSFDVQNRPAAALARRLFWRLPDRSLAGLRGIRLYGGGCWWLLERTAVERILAFLDANRWFWRRFRYTNCPDEMLFHSLMAPLGLTVGGPAPTADVWIEGNPHPETVTEAMHRAFVEGPALFARKYVDFRPDRRDGPEDAPVSRSSPPSDASAGPSTGRGARHRTPAAA